MPSLRRACYPSGVAHPRLLIALSLLWGCQPSEVVGYSEFDPDVPLPALYEVKEWTFEYNGPLENPFTHYIEVEVWRENENEDEDENDHYHIEGFYAGRDGNRDHIWKARFMPTASMIRDFSTRFISFAIRSKS